MLGKKNKEVKITTLLGKDTEISGDFKAQGSVRIDGVVDGDVTVTGTLIVGASGKISGNISAQAAVIGGEVIGNVIAPEKVEMIMSAKVIGDVETAAIVIDDHVIFQGKCNMNQDTPEKKVKAKAVRNGKKTAKAALAEALKEVRDEQQKEEEISVSQATETE